MMPFSEQAVQQAHTFITSLIHIKNLLALEKCYVEILKRSLPVAQIFQILAWLSLKFVLFWGWKKIWCSFELCKNVYVHVLWSDMSEFFLLLLNIVRVGLYNMLSGLK